METVKRAAQYCAEQGIEVILDPAPAAPCDGQLLRCTDFITPNEGELKKIACEDDMEKGARKLLDAGVKNVIKKAGAKGCYFINRDRMDYIAGFKVKAADTTGAGDSFNAGFAVARAKGYEDRKALEYAKGNPELLEDLLKTKRLPIGQLATGSGVERKTLERHRKYMVALLLIYTNGYEIIRGHLKQVMKGVAVR